MGAKRKKPMTKQEKKYRAELFKKMREDGMLPPKKKPLNRKKFAQQVMAEWEAAEDKYTLYMVMVPEALAAMVAGAEFHTTPEMVGVLKVLKLAMDGRKYKTEAHEAGRTITVGDYYDNVVKPILDL